ncbi:PH and SEC7 domain-containing protein 2-like, partial [Clarias magur]
MDQQEDEKVNYVVTEDKQIAPEDKEVASEANKQGKVGFAARKQKDPADKLTKQEELVRDVHDSVSGKIQKGKLFWKSRESRLKGQLLAKQLYQEKNYRLILTIQQLSEDLELADETLKAYVTYFCFGSMSLQESLRLILKVFWPEDEHEIQDLLINHFSHRYLTCTGQPLTLQSVVYYQSWAMIILNADLNGGHKGRKMSCEDFIANLNSAICDSQYPQEDLKNVYKSIRKKPLVLLKIKTRRLDLGRKETSIFDTNTTTVVHKTGKLICKRVQDADGRKTRKGQRGWKTFIAVVKGMVLHLQKDSSDLCEPDKTIAISLHHAMACSVYHEKRDHTLCLRSADSRVFYFQADSEREQKSWVMIFNLIAARYSAPPIIPAPPNMEAYHPQVLPSSPTTLSVEQQL